jgi:hypothetical protein
MDAVQRSALIILLRREMERSVVEALKFSKAWLSRSATISREQPDEGYEFIGKRDDMRLKEYMAGYVWHRDNSAWAHTMIQALGGGNDAS